MASLSEKTASLKRSISSSALKAGRRAEEVSILFATKSATAQQIASLSTIEPQIIIGENRVQDAEEKFSKLRELLPSLLFASIEKHMIGTLQSNKVKKAVELFDCIQSVDSLPLAQKISSHAASAGKTISIYVEVNNGEQNKHGVPLADAPALASQIRSLPALKLVGLMGMGMENNNRATREFFRSLKKQADSLSLKTSMGMSGDFEIAIEEGTDMIRVGRAVFSD